MRSKNDLAADHPHICVLWPEGFSDEADYDPAYSWNGAPIESLAEHSVGVRVKNEELGIARKAVAGSCPSCNSTALYCIGLGRCHCCNSQSLRRDQARLELASLSSPLGSGSLGKEVVARGSETRKFVPVRTWTLAGQTEI